MSLSLSQLTVPAFVQTLTALSGVLDKAHAFATAKKIDEATLLGTRLIPDMLPLGRQIQLSCDFAKNTMARLSASEPPKYEDNEKTIAELKARIEKTLAYVHSIDAAKVDAAGAAPITFPAGPGMKATLTGAVYLQHFALPNFYFHSTTAYAILRKSGVELGKRDFIGAVPGFAPVPA